MFAVCLLHLVSPSNALFIDRVGFTRSKFSIVMYYVEVKQKIVMLRNQGTDYEHRRGWAYPLVASSILHKLHLRSNSYLLWINSNYKLAIFLSKVCNYKQWAIFDYNPYLTKMGATSQKSVKDIVKSKYSFVHPKSQFQQQISCWKFTDQEL